MRIGNATVLEALFALQGSFTRGVSAPEKRFDFGIEVAPFKNAAAAAACISADFELGWGWRSRGRQGAEETGLFERHNVPMILALLEQYSIPITWATIGHLFLESCTRCDHTGLAHPDMPRPVTDGNWTGDWYANDPCSNVEHSPAWYAPDLIQQIIDSSVPHEIGTHSFSHINFTAAYSGADVVRRELERCAEVMQPYGLKPQTLVFPRNRDEYSHLPLLAEAGVIVVRHRERQARIRLSYPERTASGVYKIYESMNLRTSTRYDYLQKAKIFMQRAMEHRAVYSLWFHPSDPAHWFDPQLHDILRYMDAERQSGRLWVATMRDIAAYCEGREHLQITADRTDNTLRLFLRNTMDVSRYGAPELSIVIPVASMPRTTTLFLDRGVRTEPAVRALPGRPPQLVLNVPTNATRVELTF
jgi:peptidoglycan/xylan/chitin deacetylase (PgdA/CDA1 family)